MSHVALFGVATLDYWLQPCVVDDLVCLSITVEVVAEDIELLAQFVLQIAYGEIGGGKIF